VHKLCANSRKTDSDSIYIEGWPEPEFKAERWRYEKIEEMKQMDGPGNKKQRRQAFEQHIKDTANRIESLISKVTSDFNSDIIKNMVELAADLWLEIGTQRCRILITIPLETAENLLEGKRKESASVELIVKPKIVRFGNAAGEDLNKPPKIVANCDGEPLSVQLRSSTRR
jgi:hypothetical protein